MKKLKVYLDTSIINFLKVEDSPDYRRDTELFLETVVAPDKIEAYVSRIVIVNKQNGYHYPFRMTNPLEVLNDE